MKVLVLAAVAAAISAPAPVAAKQNNNLIAIVAAPSVEEWSETVSARLLRNAQQVPSNRRGVALVRFRCSDEGRPTAVEMYQGSGNRRLDRLAMQAVTNLRGMHPLPAGIGKEQVYEAAIIVAPTQYQLDREIKRMALARSTGGSDPAVFALTVAGGARGSF